MAWALRPIRLPDAHLPHDVLGGQPTCRACGTPWPCETAGEHLTESRCSCGAPSWWEKRGPRNWHVGPRCYTPLDVVRAQAAELSAARRPHYPPSHFYPAKPARPVRQRPPYRHTPGGPGDLQPGTWLWVRPGGLHPGWGDLHHLAMLIRLGIPRCEIWLHFDGTVHQVRPELLIVDTSAIHVPNRHQADRCCPPLPQWARWTVAQHIGHNEQQQPGARPDAEAVQEPLFPTPPKEWAHA